MTCTKSSMSLVLYFYGQDLPETGPDGLDPRLSIFHCSTSIYIYVCDSCFEVDLRFGLNI